MARLLAFNALFFLLPFAVYGLFLLARHGSVNNVADWPVRVLVLLSCAGAFLMAVALIVFVHYQGAAPGRSYHPAEIRDGKIVPGEFDPPGKTP